MRNVSLNAAIATILSAKFTAGEPQPNMVMERDCMDSNVDCAPVRQYDSARSYFGFDSAEKKKKQSRKRNKAADASRRRNRK